MTNLIENSYVRYINQILENQAPQAMVQFKIPVKVLDSSTALSIIDSLNDNFALNSKYELTLVISHLCKDYWRNKKGTLSRKEEAWLKQNERLIDTKGNLTNYRNDVAIKKSSKIKILILVGSDLISDSASLSHILNCGIDDIWKFGMNKSFYSWIKEIGFESDDVDRINEFLIGLKLNSDIITVANYLNILDFNTKELKESEFSFLARNLYKINFASLTSLRYSTSKFLSNLNTYLHISEDILNLRYQLDDTKKKTALKHISEIREILNDSDLLDESKEKFEFLTDSGLRNKHFPGFEEAEEILEALENLFNAEITENEKTKLKQCDFVIIIDKILKLKKTSKTNKDKEEEVQGSPLEMILSAIWSSFRKYREESNDEIKTVKIIPDKFWHNKALQDFSSEERTLDVVEKDKALFDEFINPLFGGIDTYLSEQNIFIQPEVTDGVFESHLENIEMYSFGAKTSATPKFQFKVKINGKIFKYFWKEYQNSSYMVNYGIVNKTFECLDGINNSSPLCLPQIRICNFGEIFASTSNEEALNNILISLNRTKNSDNFLINTLQKFRFDETDEANILIFQVWNYFVKYITDFKNKGLYSFFSASNNNGTNFYEAYSKLLNHVSTEKEECDYLGSLYQSFWIVSSDVDTNNDISEESFLSNGIISLLHPAMVEMLLSQAAYLIKSFETEIKNQESLSVNKYKQSVWDSCIEMARMQTPIPIIRTTDNKFSISSFGSDTIYRIGELQKNDNFFLTTKYSSNDLEDVTSSLSKLLKDSKETNQLFQILQDFYNSNSYAKDSISLSIIKDDNIQPVIAAIDKLREFLTKESEIKKPYTISVTFYTTPSSNISVQSYIDLFYSYWDSLTDKKEKNNNFKLVLSHRIIDFLNNENNTEFDYLFESNLDSDIIIIYEPIRDTSEGPVFIDIQNVKLSEYSSKFPIVDKLSFPEEKIKKRKKIFSNRQFVCNNSYFRFLKRLKAQETVKIDNDYLIYIDYNLGKWCKLVDYCHEHCERVVCLGSNIDRFLIEELHDNKSLELIGFGTGGGNNSNLNYTVSTLNCKPYLFKESLKETLKNTFTEMKFRDIDSYVNNLYNQNKKMSGLSLIRAIENSATLGNEKKNDYIAYALTRILAKDNSHNDNLICDTIISIDSYSHWFARTPNKDKPDLLWLQVYTDKQGSYKSQIKIKITIIECKLTESPKEKYKEIVRQLNAGADLFKSSFVPANCEDLPYDVRDWWMQLYRIIACNTLISGSTKRKLYITYLEQISEGQFEIEWETCGIIFDKNNVVVNSKGYLNLEGFDIFSIPQTEIVKICEDNYSDSWDEFKKSYNNKTTSNISNVTDFRLPSELTSEKNVADAKVNSVLSDENNSPTANMETKDEEENFDAEEMDVSPEYYDSPEDNKPKPEKDNNDEDLEITLTPTEEVVPIVKTLEEENIDNEVNSISQEETIANQAIEPSKLKSRSILLGKSEQGEKIFIDLDDKDLRNRHICILGASGGGKSYAIQCILAELCRQEIASLIVDYTEGFKESMLEEKIKQFTREQIIMNDPKSQLPINPFKRQLIQYSKDFSGEESYEALSERVTNVFSSVYPTMGDQQTALLKQAIADGVEENPNFSMANLLDEILDTPKRYQYFTNSIANSICSKINSFARRDFFTNSITEETNKMGWPFIFSKDLAPHLINIFQLSGLTPDTRYLLTGFILWDLWHYSQSNNHTQKDIKYIVLDEIQNLKPASDGLPIKKYLKEGRKLGIALISATQTINEFGSSSSIVSDLMQSATKLIFKPSDSEVKSFSNLLASLDNTKTNKDWETTLSNLNKGECILFSDLIKYKGKTIGRKIKISSFEERGL